MKIKRFTQFIGEDLSWNKGGPIAELLRKIASSAQDNGWYGYIGVSNDALEITATETWTEEEIYVGDRVFDCEIDVTCVIRPIISDEYKDSPDLARLLELGLVEIDSIVKEFEASAELTATCDDVYNFEYKDTGEVSTWMTGDLSGGEADLSDPEKFGEALVETLNEWVNEFTFGGLYKIQIAAELSNHLRDDLDDED